MKELTLEERNKLEAFRDIMREYVKRRRSSFFGWLISKLANMETKTDSFYNDVELFLSYDVDEFRKGMLGEENG